MPKYWIASSTSCANRGSTDAGARPIGGFVEGLRLILARCHASGGAYLDRRHLPRNHGAG